LRNYIDKKIIGNQTKIAKQIDNLRNTLAQTSKNNKEYDRKLKQLQAEMNEVNLVKKIIFLIFQIENFTNK